MKIAITGTLDGMQKKDAVAMMATVGAAFTDNVNYETNYLLAAMLDSNQAKKARRIGVPVITQSEFLDFIDAGAFPDNKLPTYVRQNNFPVFEWRKLPVGERVEATIEYHDEDGEVRTFSVYTVATSELPPKDGIGAPRRYLQAIDRGDGDRVKTFRRDRIVGGDRV